VQPAQRAVQYRSSGRLGQADWDTQRLRYNQFVRMLQRRGGWEVAPLPRLRYVGSAPWRWTQGLLESAQGRMVGVSTSIAYQLVDQAGKLGIPLKAVSPPPLLGSFFQTVYAAVDAALRTAGKWLGELPVMQDARLAVAGLREGWGKLHRDLPRLSTAEQR
jgi:hypothetical protein